MPGDVIHYLNNGVPAEVDLFATPSTSEQGLQTLGLYVQDSWRLNSRLTFNLGIRFDRYRAFLPEQEGPPVGRFNTTQVSFPEVSNAKTFNNPVPRLGMVFDLTGQGRTVLKANYAQYAWNPGASGSRLRAQPEHRQTGTGDIRGLTPTAICCTTQARSASSAAARRRAAPSLDPNLKNTKTSEVSAWVEHELMPGFAVQGGYVYRSIDDFRVRVNQNRPMDAYNIPITIRDPGPDGVLNNADDGAGIPGLQPERGCFGGAVGQHHNEPARQRRVPYVRVLGHETADRTLVAPGIGRRCAGTRTRTTSLLRQQPPRPVTTPSTPNDLINTGMAAASSSRCGR